MSEATAYLLEKAGDIQGAFGILLQVCAGFLSGLGGASLDIDTLSFMEFCCCHIVCVLVCVHLCVCMCIVWLLLLLMLFSQSSMLSMNMFRFAGVARPLNKDQSVTVQARGFLAVQW